MAGRLSEIINLVSNMGLRYTAFRMRYEVLRRTGAYKKKFPAAPPYKQYLTLEEWKQQGAVFFFKSKASLNFERQPHEQIKTTFNNIKEGRLLLFNSVLADLGKDYDWVTNPDSGYRYDVEKHWTEIPDYSKEAGDIKFVWEKSRFSYLYDIIRYDYHFNVDCSEMVFADILSWIKHNPVNCGPNYRCSQEMSLRVLNWTYALHYYKDAACLTAEVFNQMQYAIYWHMDHVYKNIDFSRIAVRNNHAITETLALYMTGLFYAPMPGAAEWKRKGKLWFEEEIAYQVYEDGTFLQFSMNYHRIVVQLLTWAVVVSEKNGERFSDVVYDRATKSVVFLRTCMIEQHGWLPNYGANDGALFFKLSNGHYRDYRPQLQALAMALKIDMGFGEQAEDTLWYGLSNASGNTWQPADGTHIFNKGGYYIIREPETLTFIKCGSYKDRPSQADNLHLDVWYKGENILLDAGSYKYNTDDATIRYFSGTASHNTVMVDDNDQMLKGGRFIWYYWSQSLGMGELLQDEDVYVFSGEISAFSYINKDIKHKRVVIKQKGLPVWIVKDEIANMPTGMKMRQLWHIPLKIHSNVIITAKINEYEALQPFVQDGWQSSLYGQKEKTKDLYFSTGNKTIETIIKVAEDS
jgi:hypothetical protein